MRLLDRLIAAGEDHQNAPQRALRVPSLRPYLPRRHHLRRVLGGLPVLAKMAWAAGRAGLRKAMTQPGPTDAKEGEKKQAGFPDTLERAGAAVLIVIVVLAAAAGVVSTLCAQLAPYARTVIGVSVAVLLTAAWIVGPRPSPQPASTPPAMPAEPSPEDLIERDRGALLELLDEATRGRNGIHLDPLYELTAKVPYFAGIARPQLGALLAGLGVPVVRSLSVDGVEGRTGVRRAAVEQLLADRSPTRDREHSRLSESGPDQQESRALSDGSRRPLGTTLGPP